MNLILCTAQDINENNGNVNKNSTATITITNNNNNNNNIINKSVPRKKQKKIHKITTMKNIKAEPMNHSDGGGGGGSGGGGGGANSTTAGGGGANAGGDLDDLSDDASSTENDNFDDSDLLSMSNQDDVTAQLAAAGPVGIAAAAAIATGKKRKRPHTFETNPSIRKRQQTRLLRKLKQTIDEYTTRVGQQAVVLIVTPGKPQNNFKVFGARPLESVVRQSRASIMHDLEIALAQHAPPQVKEDPSLHELPPLVVDGIPTPVEKMTQAQLRAFIPLMLKYSTGRGKPGWGKETTRPEWWPQDLPWANVRSDARNEEEKQKVSWTHALRQIVINCYKYHNREDLLPAFSEDEDKTSCAGNPPAPKEKVKNRNQTHQQQQQQQQQHHQQQQQQQSISSINVTNLAANNANITTIPITGDSASLASQGVNTLYAQPLTHYAPMVQTINNPDGSVSIIQVDPATVVAISDGNGGVRTLGSLKFQNPGGDANQNVQTLGELTTGQDHERVTQIGTVNVDLGSEGGHQSVSLAEATICPDGHIILTGEDGTQSTFPVSGMVTIPVSMYQTVVTNLNLQGDNTMPITMQQITAGNQLETNGGGNGGNVVENNDNEDVKNVLNGQNTIRITTNSEENS